MIILGQIYRNIKENMLLQVIIHTRNRIAKMRGGWYDYFTSKSQIKFFYKFIYLESNTVFVSYLNLSWQFSRRYHILMKL